MPRIKCHFCNNLLTVRPAVLKNEKYIAKCHQCRVSPPPENWRCKGIVTSDDRQHTASGRAKGDRCKCWVKEEGDDYCHYHKYQGIEHEARPNYRQ